MPCPNCGYPNVATACFCSECGSLLLKSSVGAPVSATLGAKAAEELPQRGVKSKQARTQFLVSDIEEMNVDNDTALQSGSNIAGYTVIDLHAEHDGTRVYRAQAPADVCAHCGTRAVQPDARFCEGCGAELLPRDVLLLERSKQDPDSGPWLLLDLPDDPSRELLPPVTTVEQDGRSYLVVEAAIPGWQSLAELLTSYGDSPDQPAALEDEDALPIALQLAQLLHYLHQQGLALGQLSLAHLLIGPQGRVRLRDANALQPLSNASQVNDLQYLQQTLEDLTRIPRTTRKLDTDTLEGAPGRSQSLQDVLAMSRMGSLATAEDWVMALEAVEQQERVVQGLRTRVGTCSDVGRVRDLNEDALLALDSKLEAAGRPINAGLYAVADGMGGHSAGEIASSFAVQSLATIAAPALIELLVDSESGITDAELQAVASRAAEQANLVVYEEGQRRGNDMGTTLTFALVVGDRCVVGNVGDSRTYLLRNEQLQRISKDHSLVQRLVDLGQIQPDEIYMHPHRNAITRSLGERPQIDTDLFTLRLQSGDLLVCCSDGLWEMVRDPQMRDILVSTEPEAAADQLIMEANQNGGEDNIAVVVVRFE
jgi:serine/threonine protein phosphatase PrpC